MKSPHRYVTLLATASLALSGPAFAQSSAGSTGSGTTSGSSTSTGSGANSSSSTNRTGSNSNLGSNANPTTRAGSSTGSSVSGSSTSGSTMSSTSTMSPSMGGTHAMARVTKDTVDQRFTAKDLLGAAVYDTAGERIGDIADIDLQGTVPSSLSMSFSHDDSGGVSMGSSSMSPGTNYANTGTASSNAGVSGSTGVAGQTSSPSQTGSSGTYAQSGTSSSTSQSAANRARSAASDALADSSRAISSIAGSSQATIFLSVGGLWGVGDDLVRVPISQLSYNTSEDRFELSASKAQVVALAEQKDGAQAGYAGSMDSSSTTAAKQTFGDEASRVQSALRTDPQVSAFAQGVTVNSDGDKIELHGSVQTEEQKKQILDAARRATSKDIEDELNVRD